MRGDIFTLHINDKNTKYVEVYGTSCKRCAFHTINGCAIRYNIKDSRCGEHSTPEGTVFIEYKPRAK